VLPLLQIQIPANLSMLLKTLMDIANFDFMPSGEIFEAMFNFTPTDPYLENFEQGGFETANFILNLGTLFIAVMILSVLMMIILILTMVKKLCKPFQTCYNKLCELLLWNVIIRFSIETFLDFVLCAVVNLYDLQWTTGSDVLVSLISVFIVAYCVLLMIIKPILLWKNFE